MKYQLINGIYIIIFDSRDHQLPRIIVVPLFDSDMLVFEILLKKNIVKAIFLCEMFGFKMTPEDIVGLFIML